MAPWGCLGDPRGLRGASWGTVRARLQSQLKINQKNEGFWQAPGTSREAPGDPEGAPKSTKSRFFC